MSLWQGIRFGVRVLVKGRWFTLAAVSALALGLAGKHLRVHLRQHRVAPFEYGRVSAIHIKSRRPGGQSDASRKGIAG